MNNETLNSVFTSTASAIKAKLRSQESIKPVDFADNIANIETEGGDTGIYKRARISDLPNISANLGDLAVVTRNEESQIDNTFVSGDLTTPETVIFDEAIEDSHSIMLEGETSFLDVYLQNSRCRINFQDSQDGIDIQISYSSEDGITYILQDTPETMHFENARFMEYDELCCKFLVGNVKTFDGIFEYQEEKFYRMYALDGTNLGIYTTHEDEPSIGTSSSDVFLVYNIEHSNDKITSLNTVVTAYDEGNISYYYKDGSIFIHNSSTTNTRGYRSGNGLNYSDYRDTYTEILPGESIEIISNVDLNNLSNMAFLKVADDTVVFPHIYSDETMTEILYDPVYFSKQPEHIWDFSNIGTNLSSSENVYEGNKVYTNKGFVNGTLDVRTNISSGIYVGREEPSIEANDYDMYIETQYADGALNDIGLYLSLDTDNVIEKHSFTAPFTQARIDEGIIYYSKYSSSTNKYSIVAYNVFTNEETTLRSNLNIIGELYKIGNYIYYVISKVLYQYNLLTNENTTLLSNVSKSDGIAYYERENQLLWVRSGKLVRFSLDTNTIVSDSEDWYISDQGEHFLGTISYLSDKYMIWVSNDCYITDMENNTTTKIALPTYVYYNYIYTDESNNRILIFGSGRLYIFSYNITNDTLNYEYLGNICVPILDSTGITVKDGYLWGIPIASNHDNFKIDLSTLSPYSYKLQYNNEHVETNNYILLYVNTNRNVDNYVNILKKNSRELTRVNISNVFIHYYMADKVYRYLNGQWNLLIDNTSNN